MNEGTNFPDTPIGVSPGKRNHNPFADDEIENSDSTLNINSDRSLFVGNSRKRKRVENLFVDGQDVEYDSNKNNDMLDEEEEQSLVINNIQKLKRRKTQKKENENIQQFIPENNNKEVYLIPFHSMKLIEKKPLRFPCRGTCGNIHKNDYGYSISAQDRNFLGDGYYEGVAVKESTSKDGKHYFCNECIATFNFFLSPFGPCKIAYDEVEKKNEQLEAGKLREIEKEKENNEKDIIIKKLRIENSNLKEENKKQTNEIEDIKKSSNDNKKQIEILSKKYNELKKYFRKKHFVDLSTLSYKNSDVLDRIIYTLTNDLHKFIIEIYRVLTKKSYKNSFSPTEFYVSRASLNKFPESLVAFFRTFHSSISGRNIEEREILCRMETFIRDKWAQFNFPHIINTFNLYHDGASHLIIEFCFISGTAVTVDCFHKRFSYKKLIDPYFLTHVNEFKKNDFSPIVRMLDEESPCPVQENGKIRFIYGIQHDNFKRKDENGVKWDHQTGLIHILNLEEMGFPLIDAKMMKSAIKERSKERLCIEEPLVTAEMITKMIGEKTVYSRSGGNRHNDIYEMTDLEIKFQRSQRNTNPTEMSKGKSSSFLDWAKRILALSKIWRSLNEYGWSWIVKFIIGDMEYMKHLPKLFRLYDYLNFDLTEEQRETKGWDKIDLELVASLLGIFCSFHIQFDYYAGAAPRKVKKKTGGCIQFRNMKKMIAPLMIMICGKDVFPTCYEFGFSDFHRYYVAIFQVYKKKWRTLLNGITHEHDEDMEIEMDHPTDNKFKKIIVPNAVGHMIINIMDEFIPLMIDVSQFLHTPPSKYGSKRKFDKVFKETLGRMIRLATVQNHTQVEGCLYLFINTMKKLKKKRSTIVISEMMSLLFYMLYGDKIELRHGDYEKSIDKLNRGENSSDNINYVIASIPAISKAHGFWDDQLNLKRKRTFDSERVVVTASFEQHVEKQMDSYFDIIRQCSEKSRNDPEFKPYFLKNKEDGKIVDEIMIPFPSENNGEIKMRSFSLSMVYMNIRITDERIKKSLKSFQWLDKKRIPQLEGYLDEIARFQNDQDIKKMANPDDSDFLFNKLYTKIINGEDISNCNFFSYRQKKNKETGTSPSLKQEENAFLNELIYPFLFKDMYLEKECKLVVQDLFQEFERLRSLDDKKKKRINEKFVKGRKEYIMKKMRKQMKKNNVNESGVERALLDGNTKDYQSYQFCEEFFGIKNRVKFIG